MTVQTFAIDTLNTCQKATPMPGKERGYVR